MPIDRILVALLVTWPTLSSCATTGGEKAVPVSPFHSDADLVHGRGADVGLGVPFDPATEPVVRYVVDLDAPTTQTVHVTITLPCEGFEELELFLPVWRPGRYEILDPAGSVRDVVAHADGEPRSVRKTSKSSWAVTTGGATELVVSYRVYANSLGDRTRHVDDTHAFLSGSTVFLYAPSLRAAPLSVAVRAPEDWDVATGLEPVPDEARVFFAPSYDVLVDSPLEIGLHDRHVFEVDGKPHEIVVWPAGIELDFGRIAKDLGKIVAAQEAVFGSLPYQRYVFLIHAGGGGGTEHLNSTIMQTSRSALEASVDGGSGLDRLLGLASHEFFHTWNVKQLRPAGIHPYDYQKENYTDLLWVAEGTTSYYSALTLVRAGLRKPGQYLDQLARSIGTVRRSPGARVQSVAASSFDQWISGFSPDSINTQVSIYGEGALVSLWLDLEVRRRSEGQASLDAVLRDLYERFPLSGSGYTTGDLIAALDAAVGAHRDGPFAELFARHVEGTEPLPFEANVGAVGLRLWFEPAKHPKDETEEDENGAEEAELSLKPYLGLRLADSGSGSRITGILTDGPAYGADLMVGDELLTLNEERLRAGDLDERLEDLAPGDTVRLHLLRRDELRVVDLVLAGVPDGSWKLERVEDPTDAQRAAYASWLGSEWPGKKPGAAEAEPAGP
jgi:predicted metalloprotease with PDZ domain